MTSKPENESATLKADRLFNADGTQDGFEAEFFRQILAKGSENLETTRRLAELYARRGDFENALALDRRLARLLPDSCIVHYNLACSLSMTGQTEEAIRSLDESLRLGYDDFAHLEADEDLELVRQHAGYTMLARKYGIS